MLDFGNFPTPVGAADVQFFVGSEVVGAYSFQTWTKPRGKSMIDILLVGKGGNGGAGVIGAAGGGGGGGGSGAQTRLLIPANLVPDSLFLFLPGQSVTASTASSYITLPVSNSPTVAPLATNSIAIAGGGGNGGNAATTTGGTAGAAGASGSAANMPLGWLHATTVAGNVGTVGGSGLTTGTVGLPLTLPTSGLRVSGGTGGGACPTTAALAGTAGGLFTNLGFVPAHPGGAGGNGTTPPASGSNGYRCFPNLGYWLGGTGGGGVGTNGSGAGLVQGSGGNGALGCGGGGTGGAFTGSSAGQVGLGGASFCIITCW